MKRVYEFFSSGLEPNQIGLDFLRQNIPIEQAFRKFPRFNNPYRLTSHSFLVRFWHQEGYFVFRKAVQSVRFPQGEMLGYGRRRRIRQKQGKFGEKPRAFLQSSCIRLLFAFYGNFRFVCGNKIGSCQQGRFASEGVFYADSFFGVRRKVAPV